MATEQFDGVEHCRFAFETDCFPDSELAVCHVDTWVARNWHLEELPLSVFNCAGVVTSVRPAGRAVTFLVARDDFSGTPHPRCISFSAHQFLRSLSNGSRLISAITEAGEI